jgi:hypothetical protein
MRFLYKCDRRAWGEGVRRSAIMDQVLRKTRSKLYAPCSTIHALHSIDTLTLTSILALRCPVNYLMSPFPTNNQWNSL